MNKVSLDKLWHVLIGCILQLVLACGTEVGNGRSGGGPDTPKQDPAPTSGQTTNDNMANSGSPESAPEKSYSEMFPQLPDMLFMDCVGPLEKMLVSAANLGKTKISLKNQDDKALTATLTKAAVNSWSIAKVEVENETIAANVEISEAGPNAKAALKNADGSAVLTPRYTCEKNKLSDTDIVLANSTVTWSERDHVIATTSYGQSVAIIWYFDAQGSLIYVKFKDVTVEQAASARSIQVAEFIVSYE